MATSYDFQQDAMEAIRDFIAAVEKLRSVKSEYQARGSGAFTKDGNITWPSLGVTEQQFDLSMAAIVELDSWFNTWSGYFYPAAK